MNEELIGMIIGFGGIGMIAFYVAFSKVKVKKNKLY